MERGRGGSDDPIVLIEARIASGEIDSEQVTAGTGALGARVPQARQRSHIRVSAVAAKGRSLHSLMDAAHERSALHIDILCHNARSD